jgi:D-alanine-D-alanine ligase-like ATP-grasp enzyme
LITLIFYNLIDNFLNETLGRFMTYFFNAYKNRRLAGYVEIVLYTFLRMIGMATYNTDISKVSSGRSELVWIEARKRGLRMEQIKIFNRYIDNYRVFINGGIYYFESIPIPPYLNQYGYTWLDDKLILSKKLNKNNINSPKTKLVYTLNGAIKAFRKLNKPVIVKPKNGSRGRHTTTNINTEEELIRAYKLGKQISFALVVQEHLYGSVCRATIVGDLLVGFFKALPPQITGDGKQTIEALIIEKNKNKNEKLGDILINEELINFIKRQGYNLDSILEINKTIDLIAKTGRLYGGHTREMINEVHPKIKEIFKKAAKVIEAPVGGFDLIIEDPTLDPDLQKWGIIECNSLPFIDLHYYAEEGPRINPAEKIWDLWNK